MYYFSVWVASPAYHRQEPLTYSFSTPLTKGTLVTLTLQNKKAIGIIESEVPKPAFKTKELASRITNIPLPEEFMELVSWLKAYYPAPLGSLLSAVLPSSLLSASRAKNFTESPAAKNSPVLPALTKDQADVIAAIENSDQRSYLLHGDTGSGKTRVYVELTQRMIDEGRSGLILTPEIGLTPQLADTFKERFGQRVIIMHSMLTAAKKRDLWLSILQSQEPLVIIGPRSALFTPLKNVGVVIMDEAHENAYKQEQAPYYQTSRVAAKLAHLHGAKFIMGTATPLAAELYTFQQKGLPVLRMTSPAITGAKRPEVIVVRLDDRSLFGKSHYLSDTLRQRIQGALAAKEQALIYLNRRGTARIVLCQQCGWQAVCPNCDVPLTYHGDLHEMRCHTCGHKEKAPSSCPSCKNADISFRSIGTKSLMSELTRLFPHARIQRFDTDVSKDQRLENQYEAVKSGDVDILVGTQLLGKGLDLPKLSVVGVITADTSLHMPDFTADEVTYQQLTQIIGRVGRGHRGGKVVVQTYNVDNPAIKAAVSGDSQLFYDNELKERRTYGFPPFRYLLKLECSRATPKGAETAAAALAETLRGSGLPIEVVGPTPSFYGKVAGRYRWQIIVKAVERTHLLRIVSELPANWSYDIDPANLL